MHWDLADLRSRMRGVAMASIDLPDDALVYALLEILCRSAASGPACDAAFFGEPDGTFV